MKILVFDGTAEEFQKVAPFFKESSIITKSNAVGEQMINPIRAIRCMLTRIPIPNGQLVIYKTLSNGKLEYHDFLKKIGRKPSQFAGVLGALGRRISNTQEVISSQLKGDISDVVNLEHDRATDKWYISLTSNALKALKEEGVI